MASSNTHLDALKLAHDVRDRMVNFFADDHYVRDAKLSKMCRDFWSGSQENGGLVGDLWVEGAFPAEVSQDSLESLAGQSLFDPDLMRQLDAEDRNPRQRPLYRHQAEALRTARQSATNGERPALVVTAGTGAGKTESFLLPALDELFRHPGSGDSMRCLILYPMNALVNDQVDRLHVWLRGQERVRLFHFTSETPEDARRASQMGIPPYDASRCRTRRQARGLESADGKEILPDERGPRPDIVVTNYSMLEYMLCRPQDQCFFGPELRVVILDEAHMYTGTLAAEIALLLRRLYQRCGVDPDKLLQIATSATLGGTTDELAAFTANLFTKTKDWVRTIVGERTRPPLAGVVPPATEPTPGQLAGDPWLIGATLRPDEEGRNQFIRHSEACQRLAERLPCLTAAPMPAGEDRPAVVLANTLQHASLIHRLQEILFFAREQRQSDGLRLLELARELWGSDDQTAQRATIQLLQLAAVARPQPGHYPLVPHRLHILARPTTGLSVCLDPGCCGPDEHKLSPFGCVTPGSVDTCPHCSKRLLPLCACRNCGEWLLMGERDENQYRPPRPGITKTDYLSPALDPAGDKLAADKPKFLTLGPDGKFGAQPSLEFDSQL